MEATCFTKSGDRLESWRRIGLALGATAQDLRPSLQSQPGLEETQADKLSLFCTPEQVF